MNSRERDGSKFTALKPVNCRRVNGYRLFSANVRTVFEISMLSLLLCLQIQT